MLEFFAVSITNRDSSLALRMTEKSPAWQKGARKVLLQIYLSSGCAVMKHGLLLLSYYSTIDIETQSERLKITSIGVNVHKTGQLMMYNEILLV